MVWESEIKYERYKSDEILVGERFIHVLSFIQCLFVGKKLNLTNKLILKQIYIKNKRVFITLPQPSFIFINSIY